MANLNAAFNMSQLAKLARSDNPQKRDQLFLALGSLCALEPTEQSAEGSAFNEIMFLLNNDAAENIRQQAANMLCEKSWAPRKLILQWANDAIPVANPILLKSPVLTEDDLINVIGNASLFHRLAIADRPHILEGVTNALSSFSEPEVLVAMAGNATAKMTINTFASCVRVSRRHGQLRLFLSNRDDLPRSLIPSLFAYSNTQEREIIATKFGVDVDKFSDVVRQAVLEQTSAEQELQLDTEELKIAQLVHKLAKAEQLNPASVIKAVALENILLFEHSLAQLSGVPIDQFRLAVKRSPSTAIALACQAAGIERSVFPSLHRNLTELTYLNEALSGDVGAKAAKAFSGHSSAAATVALRLMAQNT